MSAVVPIVGVAAGCRHSRTAVTPCTKRKQRNPSHTYPPRSCCSQHDRPSLRPSAIKQPRLAPQHHSPPRVIAVHCAAGGGGGTAGRHQLRRGRPVRRVRGPGAPPGGLGFGFRVQGPGSRRVLQRTETRCASSLGWACASWLGLLQDPAGPAAGLCWACALSRTGLVDDQNPAAGCCGCRSTGT